MAYVFAANGGEVGDSLVEKDKVDGKELVSKGGDSFTCPWTPTVVHR